MEIRIKKIEWIRGFTLSAILGLAGCVPQYIQPANLSASTGATITESNIHHWTTTIPSIEMKIVGVDNQSTGRFGAARALVTPGRHLITFGAYYTDGTGPFGDVGNITLSANFQSGQTYRLESSDPTHQWWGNVVRAQGWIVDASGAPASGPGAILLSGPAIIVP